MRVLKLLIIPPLFILALVVFMLWVPLPESLPGAFSRARNLPAAIVTGILGFAYVVVVIRQALRVVFAAGYILDATFASLGFSPQGFAVLGRSYAGTLNGRSVEVSFFPGQAARRPLLEISAYGSIGTRMSFGARTPLLDCSNCPVIRHDLPGLQVRAEDEAALQRLLLDPKIRETLSSLAGGDDASGYRELYLQPKRLWFRAHPVGLTEKEVLDWLGAAITLVDAIETIREKKQVLS